jgi:hypothetical protein
MKNINEDIKRILKLMEVKKEEISDEDKEEIEETEISEEGETTTGTETSTTSSGAGSATSWSQGHTKGPGNQTGNTKWADTVGSQLKRGKGNPLK